LLNSFAIKRYKNLDFLRILYLLIGIPLLYADIFYGQIFPIYNNNILMFPLSFALLELLSKKYTNKFVEKMTNGELFSLCTRCGYENIELVAKCKNCLNENNKDIGCNQRTICEIKGTFNEVRSHYEILKAVPSQRLLSIVRLESDENIIYNINVPYIRGIHKNNNKLLCQNIIITNKYFIFIDYKFYHRGWRYLDRLPISSLKNIEVGSKKVAVSEYPILRISTMDNDTYEFFVSVRNLPEQEYSSIVKEICENVHMSNDDK
jgi:hypothetical protein